MNRSPVGYVDFTYPGTLEELSRLLSASLFAGISFVGLGEGIWDEVPAVRLERDFLSLRVEMGGSPETGFTLQVEPLRFTFELEDPVGGAAEADLTRYLQFLLGGIEGLRVVPPRV